MRANIVTVLTLICILLSLPAPADAASAAARLKALGYNLPPAPLPGGAYLNTWTRGKRIIASAQPAVNRKGRIAPLCSGRPLRERYLAVAAEEAALNLLAAGVAAAGSLNRLGGLARLELHLACVPGDANLDEIADRASRVFVRVFGKNGQHARTVLAVKALPQGAAATAAGEFFLK